MNKSTREAAAKILTEKTNLQESDARDIARRLDMAELLSEKEQHHTQATNSTLELAAQIIRMQTAIGPSLEKTTRENIVKTLNDEGILAEK